MAYGSAKELWQDVVDRLRSVERRLGRIAGTAGSPTGSVLPFAGSVAPSGYLLATGGTRLIAEYPRLFDVIGTTYGGNGTTTFGIPDMRGRVPVGVSPGDSDFGALNDAVGAKTHTLTTAQMPAHNHSITRPPWRTSERVTGNQTHAPNGTYAWHTQNTTGEGGIANAGGGGAHNNIQPSRALNFIIKT